MNFKIKIKFLIVLKNLTLILITFLCINSCKSESNSKGKPVFENLEVDTTLLFGTWGIVKGGDAEFRITNKDFYVVDFFENSLYKLEKNKLIIHNSEYYREGIIMNVTKDSLKIKWDFIDNISNYWEFEN